jgi:hypothetical protein
MIGVMVLERARLFTEHMLRYVVDCNWGTVEQAMAEPGTKYAVMVGISFSVVLRIDYVPGPELTGEICRVEISPGDTQECLVSKFTQALGFALETTC